ncbi:MAG: glycosyltransferase family 4 protein [Bacteroidota bacterium]
MTKKRIAFVANTSWSIYNFRLGLIRQLKSLGYDVILIAPDDNYSAKLITAGFTFYPINFKKNGISLWDDLRIIRRFHKLYKREKIDFVFHYTIKPIVYGSFIARLNGIPSISIMTGLGYLYYCNWFIRFFAFRLLQIASWCYTKIWFLNESDRQFFLNNSLVKVAKTDILPSEGVDALHFKSTESGAQKNSTKVRFLYAGRILWKKGIKEYVEAAKIIKQDFPAVEFQLLGFVESNNPDSVPIEDIQAWTKENLIQYLGSVDDVRPYFEAASCIVLPSYREGISKTLLEAASMSKPIIATDTPGCREVVKEAYNGFLCQAGDTEDLVKKLGMMIDLPATARYQMGLNGRKIVLKKFDESLIVAHYLNTLEAYFQIAKTDAKAKWRK